VLPELVEASAFPAAAAFGARFGLADEVGKMCSDKGGDRLSMAFETKAEVQLIGHELKIGRFLQRDKSFEELFGFRRPNWPMAATGKPSGELRAVLEPACAQTVEVRAADLEVMGGFGAVDVPVVKLLQDVLEKGIG